MDIVHIGGNFETESLHQRAATMGKKRKLRLLLSQEECNSNINMLNIVKNTANREQESTIDEIDQYELKSYVYDGTKTMDQKINDNLKLEEAKLIDFGSAINIFDDERCSKVD